RSPKDITIPGIRRSNETTARAASCTATPRLLTIQPFSRGGARLANKRLKTLGRSILLVCRQWIEEFLDATLKFIEQSQKAGQPFFTWFNSTRTHVWTHLKKESYGKSGVSINADGMLELDGMVGKLLQKLDDLKIADNTIV